MSTAECLESTLAQGVLTLSLNRPSCGNALNLPILASLKNALRQAREQSSVRCVVLASKGRSFCAGADVSEWAEAEAQGRLESYGWTEHAHEVMALLHGLPKPTLAVIQGSAVGAGLDLALSCDLRLASTTARFRAGYTGMAYSPDAGASWHLPRLVGPESCYRFLFLNEFWDAQQALHQGLVGEVCEEHEIAERTQVLALRLAQGPTLAFAHTKALLMQSAQRSLPEQLEAERIAGLACGRTQDAQEALRASVERRAPVFEGR